MQIAEGADSVPVHWQQHHSNKKLSFTGETIPAARLPSLPQQDNFHDCGLFVLAYADYFLYYLPGVISHKTMNELKGGQHCLHVPCHGCLHKQTCVTQPSGMYTPGCTLRKFSMWHGCLMLGTISMPELQPAHATKMQLLCCVQIGTASPCSFPRTGLRPARHQRCEPTCGT